MALRLKIEEKYTNAIKSKNINETNTFRLIKSAIKDKDIAARSAKNNDPISDEEIILLLQSLVKQRNDSIDSFKKASREDLILIEQGEIDIISKFLPIPMDEGETEELIFKIIESNNFDSIKDMGKLMNEIKKNNPGSIDMGLAGKIAKFQLSK